MKMTSNKSSFNFRTLFSKRKEGSKENVNSDVPELTDVARSKISERRATVRQYPAKGTKILIVEDSKTVQAVLSKIFTQAGFDVLQAYDGASGVALAKEHLPSLIMMDVVMPGLTGFQATRAIRKHVETADTPIIIMSGNKQATEQFWAKKIGANAYMNKPFSRTDLFAVLDQHMQQPSLAISENNSSGEYIQPDDAYEYQKWLDV
jgi:twitching motility two-component system response regulator PilH